MTDEKLPNATGWHSANNRPVEATATARRLRRFRRVKEQLIADRGGDPTQAQTILADNAAGLAIWCEEQVEARLQPSMGLNFVPTWNGC